MPFEIVVLKGLMKITCQNADLRKMYIKVGRMEKL